MNSDSPLNPPNPGNTLNPTVAPAIPITPVRPGAEVPGTGVGGAKPVEQPFAPSEKFVFPPPGVSNPSVPTPRDDIMNIKHTAALAILGGTLLAAEQAKSFTVAPLPPVTPPSLPTVPVAAQDKTEVERLKTDLAEANKKIERLEKQVAALTELLRGKKDEQGYPLTSDPGALAQIKELTNKIEAMDKELKGLRTQTSLRPAVVPEAKPKGIVKVVNEYPIEISIVVNEKSYRVAPNTKIEVEVPAGEFTYQLLQAGGTAVRSVIKDKETVTLRIK